MGERLACAHGTGGRRDVREPVVELSPDVSGLWRRLWAPGVVAGAVPFSGGFPLNVRPANVALGRSVDVAHEDTALLASFYGLAAGDPLGRYTITSGDRSQQPASGFGGHVAPEGKSLHERWAFLHEPDEAIDVTRNGIPIARAVNPGVLTVHGLQTPVAGDDVHLTLIGWNG